MDAKSSGGRPTCCPEQPFGQRGREVHAVSQKPDSGGDIKRRPDASAGNNKRSKSIYGALDLGTNNCRLLVAVPSGNRFRVIDSFSRIVRLGEGVSRNGALSEAAQDRCIAALKVCTDKLIRRNVTRSRLIATEACRIASNGDQFIDRVEQETGLKLEIINQETEAKLALAGSAPLIDRQAKRALVFDIGGGSSELIWVERRGRVKYDVLAWTSLPMGVITLSEKYGGKDVTPENYADMKASVMEILAGFEAENQIKQGLEDNRSHLIGTSGTVTTVAGVHLGLRHYNRGRIDGCWLNNDNIDKVIDKLLAMTIDQRAANPCIGKDRADLVLAGCAILDAIRDLWPSKRIRVADRGLREGILNSLMLQDGVLRKSGNRRSRGRRRRSRGPFGRAGEMK